MEPVDIPSTPRVADKYDEAIALSPEELSTGENFNEGSGRNNRNQTSPVRFTTSINAFNLVSSPSSSSTSSGPSRDILPVLPLISADYSPATAGTVAQRRLRRPSMLSLAQTPSFSSSTGSTEDVTATGPGPPETVQNDVLPDRSPNRSVKPTQRWIAQHSSYPIARRDPTDPILMDGLSTSTPPITHTDQMEDNDSSMEFEGTNAAEGARSPLRWMPTHMQAVARRKGKAKTDEFDMHKEPYNGRPLPALLLERLIPEFSPLEDEMRSEARLQRLISSHPSALPLTPRAPRSTRGRFPEMVGGDDDEDDRDFGSIRRPPWERRRTWQGVSSDSDSDDMAEDTPVEPVNSAFAAGMDMDRPTSSSSSTVWMSTNVSESGKSTPAQAPPMGPSRSGSGSGSASGSGTGQGNTQPQPTPPSVSAQWPNSLKHGRMSFGSAGQGMVPSPGSGLGLPGAFGSLAMGGIGTPSASPTVEKLDLAGSPGTMAMSSPGMMQYRDSSASSGSLRPGKRKAQAEDRFDPYKRVRGTSPSPSLALAMNSLTSSPSYPLSPSRPSAAIPIGAPSPSHFSNTFSSNPYHSLPSRHHPYTRPMSSRSRAASPALSVGSTSGVLSTSLSSARSSATFLGGAFVPTSTIGNQPQLEAAPNLGGLGLLSLSQPQQVAKEERRGSDGIESIREESPEADVGVQEREAMEED